MMSVASEDTGGVVQKFANSGEEDADVPQEKEVPKKRWCGRRCDQRGEEAGTQRHQCSTDGEGVRRCLMREIWKRYGSRLKCF